jgi:hypothetical protein
MQRPQNVALMFVLGSVLVGGALGFATDRVMVKDNLCAPRVGERQSRDLFFDDLGFSADQRAAWDSIIDLRSKKISALFAPIQERADSVRAMYRPLMLQLLTQEQRTKLEAREARMKEERDRRSRERKPQTEK